MFYLDLGRERWLFEGNAEDSEQYELYRRMKVISGNDWSKFHSMSNRAWMAFILRELRSRYSKYTKKEQSLYEFLEKIENELDDVSFTLKEVFYKLYNFQ